jgi:hypothetical protein
MGPTQQLQDSCELHGWCSNKTQHCCLSWQGAILLWHGIQPAEHLFTQGSDVTTVKAGTQSQPDADLAEEVGAAGAGARCWGYGLALKQPRKQRVPVRARRSLCQNDFKTWTDLN